MITELWQLKSKYHNVLLYASFSIFDVFCCCLLIVYFAPIVCVYVFGSCLCTSLCPFEIILLGKRESHIKTKAQVVRVMFKLSSDLFCLTVQRQCFLWILFVIHVSICLCYVILSVPCSLLITCWERVTSWFSCVFVSLFHIVLYLFVSIYDRCLSLVAFFLLTSKSSKTKYI